MAALSGIAFLAISARSLSTAQNTAFLTFWAALFGVFAVFSGIQSEMTRAVRADQGARLTAETRTSPLGAGLMVGAVAAVVIVLLLPVWQLIFVGDQPAWVPTLLIAVAALLYAGHASTVGSLAGLGRWRGFAGLTAGESLVRLVLAVSAAVLGWGVIGFEAAALSGAVAWLVVTTLLPGWRSVWAIRIQLPLGALLRRTVNAMAAAAASALLITGFPILMSLTTDPTAYALAAPLIVAVSVTRAPLLLPVTAVQSMVIAAFVQRPERARSSLLALVASVVGVALVGGGLAALVGPWVMRVIFGPAYGNSPFVLAMLVAAAALLALLVLGGSVSLALDAHTVNTAGWYVALIVSVLLMLLPAGLEVRTILALSLGPLAGAVVHFAGVMWVLKRRTQEAV